MLARTLVIVGGLAVLTPTPAAAQAAADDPPDTASPIAPPPSPAPPLAAAPAPAPARSWYGWQLVLIDAAALALIPATQTPSPVLLWAGTGSVVHLAHNNIARAGASFGLRIALTAVGAVAGASATRGCKGWFCGVEGVAIGGMVGIGVAEVIDVAALAYAPATGEAVAGPSAARRAARSPIAVAPIVRVGPTDVGLGVVGRF